MGYSGFGEIAGDIAMAHNLTRNEVKTIIAEFFDGVRIETAQGHPVIIPNVGRIAKKHMGQRKGRNPRTGEAIIIPPRDEIKFKMNKFYKILDYDFNS